MSESICVMIMTENEDVNCDRKQPEKMWFKQRWEFDISIKQKENLNLEMSGS